MAHANVMLDGFKMKRENALYVMWDMTVPIAMVTYSIGFVYNFEEEYYNTSNTIQNVYSDAWHAQHHLTNANNVKAALCCTTRNACQRAPLGPPMLMEYALVPLTNLISLSLVFVKIRFNRKINKNSILRLSWLPNWFVLPTSTSTFIFFFFFFLSKILEIRGNCCGSDSEPIGDSGSFSSFGLSCLQAKTKIKGKALISKL